MAHREECHATTQSDFFSVSARRATTAPAAAQTPPDTVFEMPGVFRISLPQGWQRSRVIDDRQTVAAFSSKDLTLEVMRDVVNAPVERNECAG